MILRRTRTGLDVLAAEWFARWRGRRIGLVAHAASVDAELRHAAELLARADGVSLAALFGPEHGFFADAQDLIGVGRTLDPWSGRPCHSLYGSTVESLRPTAAQLDGLDRLVIDLQDVGSRYYTFAATMLYCLEAAGEIGLPVTVLDRPNPLGGQEVEGPALRPEYVSFIGPHPMPVRHGLTIGELARLFVAERSLPVELDVVPMTGWRRSWTFDQTGLPWVMPSPNMPSVDTAFVYPGQCLLEGTNLSEGRGTTRPFELCGGPGVDARELARRLNGERLDGVKFRPTWFRPTFQKWAGEQVGGVQIHVTDRSAFRPVRVGFAVLAALRELAGERFDWRRGEYEFVSDRLAIDLLFGSDRERKALESGVGWREAAAAWPAEEAEFRRRRRAARIYPD